jgi:serine/threonine protein kinase
MEYLKRDLGVEIRSRRLQGMVFDEGTVFSYFSQLVQGLAFLQRNEIHHGDLKASNVLLSDSLELKLGVPFVFYN